MSQALLKPAPRCSNCGCPCSVAPCSLNHITLYWEWKREAEAAGLTVPPLPPQWEVKP